MSKGIAFILFAISLVTVAGSQILFKARLTPLGAEFASFRPILPLVQRVLSDPLIWAAGVLVLIGASCWYISMTKLPISLMLPLASLIGPFTAIAAYFILGETLSAEKLAAIGFIVVGASWLAWLGV
ncbi:drug/metabolite transporter (DMT)-like permease [Bosea sp. OAE506]|uniref:hypothetical protein n=1 Tax=Bosea sp. OAE506 TaxID=2663870 RepID=UPI00178A3AD5